MINQYRVKHPVVVMGDHGYRMNVFNYNYFPAFLIVNFPVSFI